MHWGIINQAAFAWQLKVFTTDPSWYKYPFWHFIATLVGYTVWFGGEPDRKIWSFEVIFCVGSPQFTAGISFKIMFLEYTMKYENE